MEIQAKLVMTVAYPLEPDRMLLGLKKPRPDEPTHNIGVGLLNGFGGHVDDGQDIFTVAREELKEESGLWALSLEKRGVLLVLCHDTGQLVELHIFFTTHFSGKPRETKEMIPEWVDQAEIPFNRMWPADKAALPLMLHGQNVVGIIEYDNLEHRLLLDLTVITVSELPDHLTLDDFQDYSLYAKD